MQTPLAEDEWMQFALLHSSQHKASQHWQVNHSYGLLRSHYNQNADGNRTLDTTFLDKTLEGKGLVCSSVNSRGDCGYEAIVKAGNFQGDFRTLKTKTLAFVRSNNTAIRLQFQNAGGLPRTWKML